MIDYTINIDSGRTILTILYSLCMTDNVISENEEEQLKTIADLLNVGELERTHLLGVGLENAVRRLTRFIEKEALLGFALDLIRLDPNKNRSYSGKIKWMQDVCAIMDTPQCIRHAINHRLRAVGAGWSI